MKAVVKKVGRPPSQADLVLTYLKEREGEAVSLDELSALWGYGDWSRRDATVREGIDGARGRLRSDRERIVALHNRRYVYFRAGMTLEVWHMATWE